MPAQAELQPNDVILVAGDTSPHSPFTTANYIADYLLMCQPLPGVQVLQLGQDREGLERFMKRIESDCAPYRPTVALIYHGVEEVNGKNPVGNFLHHKLYVAKTIADLKKIGVRTIIVGSANCVDSFYYNNNPAEAAFCNKNLAILRDVDKPIVEKEGVPFADIYQLMSDIMPKAKAAFGEKYAFVGTDGIHPGSNGQLIIAYAFLKSLGCGGAIGTLTVDLAAKKAEGTAGQKILSFENNTVELESTRYPFCFFGEPANPESSSGIIQFFPFNEDLNRYMLVVKGLAAAKAKVTWGTESRDFAADDLAKGVNLAAAFAAHTPFDTQFRKVNSAVRDQQEHEPYLCETVFHNLGVFRKLAPDHPDAVDGLARAALQQNKTKADKAAALVIPVRCTLKIEAIP